MDLTHFGLRSDHGLALARYAERSMAAMPVWSVATPGVLICRCEGASDTLDRDRVNMDLAEEAHRGERV